MKALRRQLTKEKFHLLDIPEDFAEEVEIIILATKPSEKYRQLSEEEEYYAVNIDGVTEDDEEENKIWEKYL